YTGDGYEKINGYLRNGKGQKKVVKKAQLVQKGISKFKLRYNTTVYRGISNKGLKLSLNNRGLSVGSIYQDKAFSSTSLSKQVALGFSSQCLLRINIPAGVHGAYIDPISKNKGEKEYLLKEGQKLIVTKIQNASYTEATKIYLIKNKGSKVVQHTTNNVKGNYKLITLNLLN
ncbi:ADP-ribosyltransferase, partial [Levilactobacillus brevis]